MKLARWSGKKGLPRASAVLSALIGFPSSLEEAAQGLTHDSLEYLTIEWQISKSFV
jgi:hypothetical protein